MLLVFRNMSLLSSHGGEYVQARTSMLALVVQQG